MSAPSGYSRHYTQFCQQRGCDVGAVRFIRRGEQMTDLALCSEHARAFHDLSDAAAFRVAADSQPRRVLNVPPTRKAAA